MTLAWVEAVSTVLLVHYTFGMVNADWEARWTERCIKSRIYLHRKAVLTWAVISTLEVVNAGLSTIELCFEILIDLI